MKSSVKGTLISYYPPISSHANVSQDIMHVVITITKLLSIIHVPSHVRELCHTHIVRKFSVFFQLFPKWALLFWYNNLNKRYKLLNLRSTIYRKGLYLGTQMVCGQIRFADTFCTNTDPTDSIFISQMFVTSRQVK